MRKGEGEKGKRREDGGGRKEQEGEKGRKEEKGRVGKEEEEGERRGDGEYRRMIGKAKKRAKRKWKKLGRNYGKST